MTGVQTCALPISTGASGGQLEKSPGAFACLNTCSVEIFKMPFGAPTESPMNLTPTAAQAGPSGNAGKMMTRRLQTHDRSTVILTYSTRDANALRMAVQSIRLKGTRKPSLSLIARRSLHLYLSGLAGAQENRLDLYEAEIATLESMVTDHPSPALKSKRKAP